MTRRELADALAARAEITKALAERLVEAIFDTMKRALVSGEGIEIRGFGSFSVRGYASYAGRNPKTGEDTRVGAKRLPHFKVALALRALVEEGRVSYPLAERDSDGGEECGCRPRVDADVGGPRLTARRGRDS